MYTYFNWPQNAVTSFNPFPHTRTLRQTTLNTFCQTIEDLYNWMDNQWLKVEKHCGRWRNCSFWAISSFVTMFSKSRLLQRREKAYIWGKGLNIRGAVRITFAFACSGDKQAYTFNLITTKLEKEHEYLSIPYVKPFPTYNKSAADDFENIVTKTWKISVKDSLIVE